MQMGSFFVMQGANMDRNMFGGRFVIPSASLSLFNTISIITLIPIYDRGVVPLLQRFGVKITHLQRIGKSSGIAPVHSNCCGVQRRQIEDAHLAFLAMFLRAVPVKDPGHSSHDFLRLTAWPEKAELSFQAGAYLCACCRCWRGVLWRRSGSACSSRAMC